MRFCSAGAANRHVGVSESALEAAYFRELLKWYRRERRDLPWRRTRDPYAILVSEIMLQQTRVEAVIPFYLRFLERFPTAQALADAPLESVYERWAGLGYYRRARNLQLAAQAVIVQGEFPATLEGLRALPGVGDYTAAAVLSIAFETPAVALDGNALRVLCRLHALASPPLALATKRELTVRTLPSIPTDSASDFTQAIMELGARVCLPRQPQCLICPLQPGCRAFREGLTASIPKAPPPARREKVLLWAVRIRRGSLVLLERREKDPFLAHQWVTPWFFGPAEEVVARYQAHFPGPAARLVGRARHGVTFRDLEIDVWDWETTREDCGEEQRWVDWAAGEMRLPRLASRVLELQG